MSETVAVFGGSFDPPHVAHTLAAAYVLNAYPVDRLLVMPTGSHPFDKKLSDFSHRLHMCQLAMATLRDVEISSLEADLQGPSLTLRTLEALQAQHPEARLRLVIGSDLMDETSSWHRFDRIVEIAPLIVVNRGGHEHSLANGPALPMVSSTQVRELLRAGQDPTGLLAPAVIAYALAQGLYT